MPWLRRILPLLLPLLLTAGAAGPVPAQFAWPAPPPAVDDGPYVFWKGREAELLEIHQGKALRRPLPAPFQVNLPGLAAEPLRLDPAPIPPAQAEFPQPERILAVSDVHGAFANLRSLLRAQGVIDGGLRWTFGQGHLVVVGDVFDRGGQVTETLWFLHALEGPARRAGGAVHLLLGNHEAMVLRGDLRYNHPKYQALARIEGAGALDVLLGRDSELGRWLRSRPVLLRLGGWLFVHGGISPELAAKGKTLAAINAGVRQGLDAASPDPDFDFLYGPFGPIWYRGLIPGMDRPRECSEPALAPTLAAFGVRAVVVGHSTLDHARAFHGGRVYGIDAGLKDGKPGEAWILDRGRILRGLADGTREPF